MVEQVGSPVLDARGHFWWADDPVPEGAFAPVGALTGRVQIDRDGQARLDLDGRLDRGDGSEALDSVLQKQPIDRAIAGVLAEGRRAVLLLELLEAGTSIVFGGPETESFQAFTSLVGPRRLAGVAELLRVREIEIELDGLEDWLGLGGIEAKVEDGAVEAAYSPPPPRCYATPMGQLRLTFGLLGPSRSTRGYTLQLRQTACLTFTPSGPMPLKAAARWRSWLEDLFVLLTDVVRPLDWATVRFAGASGAFRLYQAQTRRPDARVTGNECWLNFPQIEDAFGGLVDAWMDQHEASGPGFHLYTATRRGLHLYTEHRFTSLIWGLESLHRRGFDPPAPPLAAKVERIVAQVSDPKDQKWLRARLRIGHEPALAVRIREVLEPLPLDLDSKRLKAFAERCAQRRNDISHFGGQRVDGAYADFVRELQILSGALDPLYHARLLQIIGAPPDELAARFAEGHVGHQLRRQLAAAGLVPGAE